MGAALTAVPPLMAALLLAVSGAIVGSFLATVILRGPTGTDLIAGRSRCDSCGVTLRWFELIPLLSALLQRGRCRRCGAAIPRLHGRVEMITALMGAVLGLALPFAQAASLALAAWLVLALALSDARDHWLPDLLTLPLALLGLLLGGKAFGVPIEDRVIGLVVGYLALVTVGWSYRLLRGRDGLGGGDPKLLGALGAWFGWMLLPPLLLLAAFLGIGWALVTGKRSDAELPFGLFLALGAAVVAVYRLVAA